VRDEAYKLPSGFRKRLFVMELGPDEKVEQEEEDRRKENDAH